MSPKGDDRRRRSLQDDERALWHKVTRSIAPLRRIPQATAKEPERASDPVPAKPKPAAASAPPAPKPKLPPALAPLGRRVKQQLSRGRAAIDARIDLHGLTQHEAHDALRRFLRKQQARGAKFVLVITGKGRDGDAFGERGVLRRQVPHWLKLAELRDIVLGFEAAHVSHGGEGALYVRLRRARGE